MGRGYTYVFERKPSIVLKTFSGTPIFFFFFFNLPRRNAPAHIYALRPDKIQVAAFPTYSHVRRVRPNVLLSGRVTRSYSARPLCLTLRHVAIALCIVVYSAIYVSDRSSRKTRRAACVNSISAVYH